MSQANWWVVDSSTAHITQRQPMHPHCPPPAVAIRNQIDGNLWCGTQALARAHQERIMDEMTLTPREYTLAGDATFTIHSLRTDTHFTFKVQQPDNDSPHFVKVLTGAENTNDYTFLGTIFSGHTYRHGKKSRISAEAPSAKAFQWFWNHVDRLDFKRVLFLKHSTCCACGRELTTPESIRLGIGPTCLAKLGRTPNEEYEEFTESEGEHFAGKAIFV